MNHKKCPICDAQINDESAKVCPECGVNLILSHKNNDEISEEVINVQLEDDTEQLLEEPKADKNVKIITAVVAAVLVLVVALGGWYVWKKTTDVKDLVFEDISGVYADIPTGMYFEFTREKTKIEVPDESVQDTSYDSAASSDAQPKTKTLTFDGRYENGFTDEYVQGILASIYITQNELTEDYEKYLEENKIASDDFLGFTQSRGVSQSELDAIDETEQISMRAEAYTDSGYWNFDSKTKEITIYNISGVEVTKLKVVGDAIVDPSGYRAGEVKDKEKFTSSFAYSEEGYDEIFFLYDDGNYIVKSEQEDAQTQYYAGTYKTDEKTVVLDMNGKKMTYTKVKGGISFVTYQKQN